MNLSADKHGNGSVRTGEFMTKLSNATEIHEEMGYDLYLLKSTGLDSNGVSLVVGQDDAIKLFGRTVKVTVEVIE